MSTPLYSTTAPPPLLVVQPQRIPAPVADAPRWLGLRADWIPQRQKYNKPPVDARGHVCDKRDEAAWMSLVDALRTMRLYGLAGVGRVLLKDEHIVGIDVDRCRDPLTGAIDPSAQIIIDSCASYAEASLSGTGIRIFVFGSLPEEVHSGRRSGPVELYHHHAFLGVTGHHLAGTPTTVELNQPAVDALYARILASRAGSRQDTRHVPTDTPPPLSDSALLERAYRAGNAAKFERLWAGDTTGYTSASEADLALASLLAFWSTDAAQVGRLLRQSGLCRAKWERHANYLDGTIRLALGRSEHWTPTAGPRRRRAVPLPVPTRRPSIPLPEPTRRSGVLLPPVSREHIGRA